MAKVLSPPFLVLQTLHRNSTRSECVPSLWAPGPVDGNTLTPRGITVEGQEDEICGALGTLTLTRLPEKETRFTSGYCQ